MLWSPDAELHAERTRSHRSGTLHAALRSTRDERGNRETGMADDKSNAGGQDQPRVALTEDYEIQD
jgi:Flp pilus assembly protein CpaB